MNRWTHASTIAFATLLAACGGGDAEVTQYGPNPDLPEPRRGSGRSGFGPYCVTSASPPQAASSAASAIVETRIQRFI